MNVGKLVGCSVLLLSLGFIVAEAQPAKEYPPGWPRPGSTTLIDNDRGAAYNVLYPKGVPTPMHLHRYSFAGLELSTASIKLTQLDGTSDIRPVVKNDMWFLTIPEPHQEMSITDPGRHTVVIDIKNKHVAEAKNTTAFRTDKYAEFQKKVVENDLVVIWDCAWAPGAKGTPSFDTRDMFLAFAEGGDLSVAAPGQPATVHHYDSGQAIFLPGGQARTISSAGGTIHAMLVEVK
jgi:hypothetical protein